METKDADGYSRIDSMQFISNVMLAYIINKGFLVKGYTSQKLMIYRDFPPLMLSR